MLAWLSNLPLHSNLLHSILVPCPLKWGLCSRLIVDDNQLITLSHYQTMVDSIFLGLRLCTGRGNLIFLLSSTKHLFSYYFNCVRLHTSNFLVLKLIMEGGGPKVFLSLDWSKEFGLFSCLTASGKWGWILKWNIEQ